MKLKYYPATLELKHTFTVSSYSRKTTPIVLTEIEHDGFIGYGEASMPQYLGESHDSVMNFLSKINLEKYKNPFELETILSDIDKIESNNCAAKASVDIALHDLIGKLVNQPWYNILGLNKNNTPVTSFTIGIDTPEIIKQKVGEANEFRIIKVKLGTENDKEIIETIRSISDKPISVDANQGWKIKELALDMIYWLKEKNVLFIEQPMPKNNFDEVAWLTDRSPLPTFADEDVQRLSDIIKVKGVYSGINIKLMKCTGIREAVKMITLAKALNMMVMLGCMTETSCAISAAAQLSPLVDYADLDGNLLIKNDVFTGSKIVNGKIYLNSMPGIGVTKLE